MKLYVKEAIPTNTAMSITSVLGSCYNSKPQTLLFSILALNTNILATASLSGWELKTSYASASDADYKTKLGPHFSSGPAFQQFALSSPRRGGAARWSRPLASVFQQQQYSSSSASCLLLLPEHRAGSSARSLRLPHRVIDPLVLTCNLQKHFEKPCANI